MQAAIYERYGGPEAVRVREVPRPTPAANEILVRVGATTVSPVDCAFRAGSPFAARLFTGLLRPKRRILGTELAGRVVAVGQDVTRFAEGDVVFGCSDDTFGTHAEYVTLPAEGVLLPVPASLSIAEAAAAAGGGLTALPFLRDVAKLQPGQRILIIGAAGSIGSVAVPLAKHFGAHVTGVCSTRNVPLVRSLGADAVVDYATDDFTQRPDRYDVVFDAVAKSSFGACRGVLVDRGIYMTTAVSLGILLQMAWTRVRGGKRAAFAATGVRSPEDKRADLETLRTLFEAGTLRPVIGRQMPLSAIADAYRHVETGHKRGNLILTLESPPAPAG